MNTLKALLVLALFSFLPGDFLKPISSPKAVEVFKILEAEGEHLTKEEKQEIASEILQISEKHRIDPLLVMAMMHVESRFDPWAASGAGALGLLQIKPIVMREMADELQIGPQGYLRLLTSREFNIRVGVTYFSMLQKKFKGDTAKALMAYNRGPTAVAREYKGHPVPEGGYQGKVLQKYAFYSGK
ncbi:MAG: lytic transglycosylase domain-containing protein [Deltaproteobacteria bacterium]|nr:lytic transglycosylase domain-containing protein [Deltaproteobacteria bacterium]